MKCITREIKMYVHTFANVDVSSGKLLNQFQVSKPYKLTRKEKSDISKENGNAILVHTEETPVKYSLPIERFIQACEEYAKDVQYGAAEPITETDEEEAE